MKGWWSCHKLETNDACALLKGEKVCSGKALGLDTLLLFCKDYLDDLCEKENFDFIIIQSILFKDVTTCILSYICTQPIRILLVHKSVKKSLPTNLNVSSPNKWGLYVAHTATTT